MNAFVNKPKKREQTKMLCASNLSANPRGKEKQFVVAKDRKKNRKTKIAEKKLTYVRFVN